MGAFNEYKAAADSFRNLMEKHATSDEMRNSLSKEIEAYDCLAFCEEKGIIREVAAILMNGGIFNDAMYGYLTMALDDVEFNDNAMKEAIIGNLRYFLDTKTAEEAAKYYRES